MKKKQNNFVLSLFSILFEIIILDDWLLLFLVDLVMINKLEINVTE